MAKFLMVTISSTGTLWLGSPNCSALLQTKLEHFSELHEQTSTASQLLTDDNSTLGKSGPLKAGHTGIPFLIYRSEINCSVVWCEVKPKAQTYFLCPVFTTWRTSPWDACRLFQAVPQHSPGDSWEESDSKSPAAHQSYPWTIFKAWRMTLKSQ